MTEMILFHHLLGLTDGIHAFADELRADGHIVHTPDLFDGRRPVSLDDGLSYLRDVGDEAMSQRAEQAVAGLPEDLVYAGFSWGASTAQQYAQTRRGAQGALLYEACIPVTGEWAFGPWPSGVPVQIHGMDQDPFFGLEGDIDAARELVDQAGPALAELFVYSGDQHLFTDSSLPPYDRDAAMQVVQRSREFLGRAG